MTLQGWLQVGLTLLIGFLISIPVGRYLASVVTGRATLLDGVFDPVDNCIYLLIGKRICTQAMDWKAYTLHMLATNLFMAIIIFLILAFQEYLPLNPRHLAGMEPMLAFNTAVSFITNTDWQAYGGETTLSNFSQMAAITFPMFTSAATGFVVAMAFIRAFTVHDGGANLGNFYRDLIRFTTRVLMPAAFVLAILLIQQGEPQTLAASAAAKTVLGAEQTIAFGPVASFETIKHLGTNGGGFFNANAAHPFENPTPVTNLVQALLMIVLPSSIVLCFGEMIGNRRQGWMLYGVMAAMLIMFLPAVVVPEQGGMPLLAKAGIETTATANEPGGNMEGKEVRIRHRAKRIVRRGHHALYNRQRELHARQLYAARRHGHVHWYDVAMRVRRKGCGLPCRFGVRHHRRFRCRTDGRSHAAISRQENREARDRPGRADVVDPPASDPRSDRLVGRGALRGSRDG